MAQLATPVQLAAWRRSATDALAAAVVAAPDGFVPAYPGWTNRDLAVHVLRIYGNARVAASSGSLEPPQPEVPVTAADTAETLAATLGDALAAAEDALSTCDAARVWTPLGPRSTPFWERRLVREAVLHCFDAEQAAGRASSPAPEVARELIDEFLQTDVPRAFAHGAHPSGTVTLVSDIARWRVDLVAGEVVHDPEDTTAAMIRGDTASVWLWLMRRRPLPEEVTSTDPDGSVAAFAGMIDAFNRPSS